MGGTYWGRLRIGVVAAILLGMNTNSEVPGVAEAAVMLRGAVGQIEFARQYTRTLLDATPREHWFTIPSGHASNIAWQVGHLAVSQYGLLMFRLRGRRPEDLELIPGRFRKAYARQSTPAADPAEQPSADELIEKLDRVHQISAAELSEIDPQVLLEPVEMPYAAFPIKLGAVLFCPLHEHIHAGQIGSLRRSFGLDPVR